MTFKELLKTRNITQLELAKEIGVAQQTISTWCCVTRVPRVKQIKIIAKTLGISDQEVFDCFK